MRSSPHLWIGLLVCLALEAPAAGGVPGPDSVTNALPAPQTLFSNLLARAAFVSTQSFKSQFAYVKLRATEELDNKGKVTSKEEKIMEATPINGRLFTRVVSENGKPPPNKQRKAQDEAERALRAAPPPEPGSIRQPAQPRRDGVISPELFARFNFTTVGREPVNGRDAWVIAFEPRRGDLPVKKFTDRIVNKVAGKVWIDVEENEVAKADIRLTSHVELIGGIVATLKRFDLIFEQQRFDGGAWFNTRTEASVEGREIIINRRIHYIEKMSDIKRVAPARTSPPGTGVQ
ncbi:MAG: hypothetical protein HY300_03520 [Verrucomicrobia bacterium]|nr:hypothetical protein [Verrucomicrobiota bacterium]